MGCDGCDWDNWNYKYIKQFGLMLESDYDYKGVNQDCHYDATKRVGNIKKVNIIQSKSKKAMKKALNNGPVAVAVYADPFLNYSSGILSVNECNSGGVYLSHAVLAVGYGSENGMDYWIVRNSWGEDWGESGYIRLESQKGGQGACGV